MVAGTEILLLGAVLLVTLLWIFRRNGRKLPPGPYSLPLVGYMPFLTFKPYVKLMELSKKYGPIFSIKLGSRYTVILSDYQSVKEAFGQDAFIGRPPNSQFKLSKETVEMQATMGLPWKEQRRFSVHLLRELGLGRSVMQQHVKEEIEELIQRIKKVVGEPTNISKLLVPSMSNNIASLVFGQRRRYDDPKRLMLDETLNEAGKRIGRRAWLMFFPWLQSIVRFLDSRNKNDALNNFIKYVDDEVAEHQRMLDPNNIRDFIDGYLLEIEKKKSDPKTTFRVPVMKDLVRGFFGAGSETVRITMDWLLLVCATHQDVQRKVQAEIDEVVGSERFPSKEDDQKKMPYTMAVITETMRWRSPLALNLFRYTLEDTHLLSFFIPKHSYVLANLWAVLHDSKIWGDDAEDFKPERFLSEDGKEFRKSEYFIPFSIGKRACPGESLANMEVFMYFAALLQKFRFELPSGVRPDFEGQLGIGLSPKPYDLVVTLR